MSIRLATTVRNARVQAIIDAIGNNGKIEIYSGAQPAVAGGTTTAVKLAELDLSTVAGTVSNGILTFNPISNDISADADGFATWGRMLTSGDVFVLDFDCGTQNTVATLKFTDTLFATGDVVEIQSFTLTDGNV